MGAILTQNVAWNNVEKAINNLQGKDLLSVAGLVQVPREELAELIIPTRYYNQKATRLKGFMIMVEEEFSGEMDKLLALETDELRRLLLKSKGIGKETADSILLYAADRPVFVVDAYTRRIFHGWDMWRKKSVTMRCRRFSLTICRLILICLMSTML